MKYEVAYKCVLEIPGDVFYEFPVLIIRYRPVGTIRWKRKRLPIDYLAKSRNYGGYSSSLPLHMYSRSYRIEHFDKALHERFNGDMDLYVKEVAYMEILNERNIKKHENWSKATMYNWLTHKWKYLEVDIPD